MVGLIAPWALVFCIIISTACLLFRKFRWSIFFVVITIFANIAFEVFLILHRFGHSGDKTNLAVMAFNINGCGDGDIVSVKKVADMIINSDADVVFLSEDFVQCVDVLDSLLLPVYGFSDYEHKDYWHHTYSKYSLHDIRRIRIKSTPYSFLFHSSITVDNDTVHIYGCHLASNNYNEHNKYTRPEGINNMNSLLGYIDNISRATEQRVEEVDSILADFKHCSGSCIIMGDFNDVSGSKPIRMLERNGFYDAWWKGGLGYGATIHKPLPYRIDHIMYNEGLRLQSVKCVSSNELSDHDALVATFFFAGIINL